MAFAGNQIPLSRIDPVAIKLINLLPAPTAAGATRNFIFSPVSAERADEFDIRGDHNPGAGDRIFDQGNDPEMRLDPMT